jgi:Xaa-Pro aminopeptidase
LGNRLQTEKQGKINVLRKYIYNQKVRTKRADRLRSDFLLGNTLSPMNYPDNTFPFRQDSSFLYYFALDTPDLAAVINREKLANAR